MKATTRRDGIVFVAINPGSRWHVGNSGPFSRVAAEYKPPNPSAKVFVQALEKAGYNRDNVFVTNLVM